MLVQVQVANAPMKTQWLRVKPVPDG